MNMEQEVKNDALLFISRTIGYSVVLICFFMKLPQILAIYSAKSSKGINLRGCWMEIGSFLISASYGYFYSFHFSNYGDSVLLAVQSSIIIYLVVYYGNLWTLENALIALFYLIFITTSLLRIIPAPIINFLLLSGIPMAVASSLAQIREIYRAKSQGDVSVLMWSLAAYGCAVLLNFFVGLILCSTIVVLCLYYGKPDAKKKE